MIAASVATMESDPAWKDVDEATFLGHLWQEKHAITTVEKLVAAAIG